MAPSGHGTSPTHTGLPQNVVPLFYDLPLASLNNSKMWFYIEHGRLGKKQMKINLVESGYTEKFGGGAEKLCYMQAFVRGMKLVKSSGGYPGICSESVICHERILLILL